MGAYPHSGDFVMPNWQFGNIISPQDYLAEAQKWGSDGGAGNRVLLWTRGRSTSKLLREELPKSIPPS